MRQAPFVVAVAIVACAGSAALGAVGAVRGARGERGPQGARGTAGRATVISQSIAINWQNDRAAGRDRQRFVAPGIGRGEVVCSRNAQQVRLRPFDQRADTVMWTTRIERGDTDVRTARRERNTGPEFNEGMNLVGDAPEGNGTFVGLISSRGDRDGDGGPGPHPTAFRLSWHWQFGDGAPRCYVAGTFTTVA
jgi:hypothetical protein